jgi:hypothetical protein
MAKHALLDFSREPRLSHLKTGSEEACFGSSNFMKSMFFRTSQHNLSIEMVKIRIPLPQNPKRASRSNPPPSQA